MKKKGAGGEGREDCGCRVMAVRWWKVLGDGSVFFCIFEIFFNILHECNSVFGIIFFVYYSNIIYE